MSGILDTRTPTFYNSGESCREKHEICDNKTCEKKYPKIWCYYVQFNYCKFGSFCSFAHHSSRDILEIKSKLKVIKLEDKVKQQENEIKALNTKMKYVEKRNEIIEKQLKGGLESLKVISESVVKEATDTVVRTSWSWAVTSSRLEVVVGGVKFGVEVEAHHY